MSLQEIEKAITQLPASELTELVTWIAEHHHAIWDRQIEDDLESGRLNNLLNEAESPQRPPLDVPGIDLNISTPEIIEFMHEGRKPF